MFYIIYPDLRKRRPNWSLYGKWYPYMDLPPAPYWHPRYAIRAYGEGRSPKDRRLLPGDRIELVAILTDERAQSYYGIPVRRVRERVRVLRRVRLTKAYAYEELFQSELYKQWRADGTLQEYDLRPVPSVLPRRIRQRKK